MNRSFVGSRCEGALARERQQVLRWFRKDEPLPKHRVRHQTARVAFLNSAPKGQDLHRNRLEEKTEPTEEVRRRVALYQSRAKGSGSEAMAF